MGQLRRADLSELFAGTEITLGAEYFNTVTAPLFIAMYILMGVAPLSAWGATAVARLGRALIVPIVLTLITLVVVFVMGTQSFGALLGYGVVLLSGFVALYEIYRGAAARVRIAGESFITALIAIFTRNRRRYGGFVVHLGITVIGIGVIGSTLFQQETQRTIRQGEAIEFGGYTMIYDRMHAGQIAEDGRVMDIADVRILRGGQELAVVRPRYDFYPEATGMNSQIIAGAYSTLENDVYVLLSGFQEVNGQPGGAATFKIYINPLINLVWYGGIILILGTLISVAPSEGGRKTVIVEERRASRAGASA
ncbi:MAG: hypothetical protein IPK19_26685 [Chloroflexi bacterium]|nr:hypothetical protein [Chloroflexota bacterium]